MLESRLRLYTARGSKNLRRVVGVFFLKHSKKIKKIRTKYCYDNITIFECF
jgi:hypothetical protein